jgi:hypothetical protein
VISYRDILVVAIEKIASGSFPDLSGYGSHGMCGQFLSTEPNHMGFLIQLTLKHIEKLQ